MTHHISKYSFEETIEELSYAAPNNILWDHDIMKSPINDDTINYIETRLFDPILMQCLITQIERDFMYAITNVHVWSIILDNNIDAIQCLEVIIMKVTKRENCKTLVREMFLAPQM